jgi:putative hemolysin
LQDCHAVFTGLQHGPALFSGVNTSLSFAPPALEHEGDSAQASNATARLGSRILARGGGRHSYSVRLAESLADVRAAQTLRFLVFNLELNEGLEASFDTCRDEDPFDEVCDHLLVESDGEVVGTYRLQTGHNAAGCRGYYSEQEFDFSPFEEERDEMVELGRACVAREHRNLIVLGLLWRGIANYARERGCRYLIGCGSLTSQDEREGAALYLALAERHLAAEAWRTVPLPAYVCPLEAAAEKAPRLPKLLAAYLSLGAKICGQPAIDRDFKTIDFLTLLDLETLPASAARLIG